MSDSGLRWRFSIYIFFARGEPFASSADLTPRNLINIIFIMSTPLSRPNKVRRFVYTPNFIEIEETFCGRQMDVQTDERTDI